jgi:hypothetical protein
MDAAELARETALSDEAIEERAAKIDAQDIAGFRDMIKQVKEETETLTGAFDMKRIKTVDQCYSLILAFIQFISFDFFHLLKKFDPALRERNFNHTPHFKPVKANLVIEMINDFLERSFAPDPEQDWQTALRVMKTYKNSVDVINGNRWKKLLIQLRDIRNSQIFDLIIRYVEENPEWTPHAVIPSTAITRPWLESKRTSVENTLERLTDARWNTQVSVLSRELFGDADITRLQNYTDVLSTMLLKKKFEGFTRTRELNFFKAFMEDHFHRDIQKLCELLLIRGKWMNPALSLPLSDQFNGILAFSDRLIRFDQGLGENSDNGSRLRKALKLVDRNKNHSLHIRAILSQANEEADDIIIAGMQLFTALGQTLKTILDDYQKTTPELIINWKEMEFAALTPLDQLISEMNKSINALLQILRAFVQIDQQAC